MSGESIGYVLGRCILIFIGIGVSLFLRRKRADGKLPIWPIGVGVVLTVLSLIGSMPASAGAGR